MDVRDGQNIARKKSLRNQAAMSKCLKLAESIQKKQ